MSEIIDTLRTVFVTLNLCILNSFLSSFYSHKQKIYIRNSKICANEMSKQISRQDSSFLYTNWVFSSFLQSWITGGIFAVQQIFRSITIKLIIAQQKFCSISNMGKNQQNFSIWMVKCKRKSGKIDGNKNKSKYIYPSFDDFPYVINIFR